MSLTRKELDELALKVAVQVAVDMWPYESHFEAELTDSDREYYGKFAHALLTQVQKRLKVAGYLNQHDSFYNIDNPWVKHNSQCVTPLYAIPFIKEGE